MMRDSERITTLVKIEEQLEVLRRTAFAKLIPEVGSNLAYAIKEPASFRDVAAVPGRIRNAMGRPAFLKPTFGASRHVASMILVAMRLDPQKRCALNIIHSDEIIATCKSIGLKTVFVDRMEEPEGVSGKEGASVPWVLQRAIEECGMVPDVIYHKGAVGKEAITMILGKDPADVAGTAMELLKRL